jgi:hypothetical protein
MLARRAFAHQRPRTPPTLRIHDLQEQSRCSPARRSACAIGSHSAGRRAEPAVGAGRAEEPAASLTATFERDRHGFQASPPPFRKRSGCRRLQFCVGRTRVRATQRRTMARPAESRCTASVHSSEACCSISSEPEQMTRLSRREQSRGTRSPKRPNVTVAGRLDPNETSSRASGGTSIQYSSL